MNNTIKLIIAIVVSQLAGIIGSIFTAPAIGDWYTTLIRPALNPPSWVFGPVWITLYALMGISAFLVWKKGLDRKDVKIALSIFFVQLILNTLWSIIFFGLRSPAGAFLEIILLWIAILATMFAFARISKPAVWLLVPYILWVSFAGYLNYSIWQLNSSADSGQIACTMEAKMCPDGSYVGRTGPKCEFAPCPSWETYRNEQYGYQIQYPKTAKSSISSENGYLQELDLSAEGGEKIKIFIYFPKYEFCGRYGPGVASQKTTENVAINGTNYELSGWIEDPENYDEWLKNNPQYDQNADRVIDSYSKTLSLCQNDKFSLIYSIEVNGSAQERIDFADSLAKEIVSTFKILK